MNSELTTSISAKIAETSVVLNQNAPAIGFWGGLLCLLGGSCWAVYNGCTKIPKIKMEADAELAVLMQNMMITDSRELAIKAKEIVRKRNRAIAKALIGPGILMTGGTALEISGWVGINNSLDSVAKQLAAQTAAFSAYRVRTSEKLGEEQEKALYYGKDYMEMTTEVTDENGNVIGTKTEAVLMDSKADVPVDPYTYEFSHDITDFCEANDDMHEVNLTHLARLQEVFNDSLQKNHVVYLNDILRCLYIEDPENFTAKRVGWLHPDYFDTPGDGFIDFRVQPMRYIASDGVERWKYMLNFNCDGDISTIGLKQRGVQGQIKKQWGTD